MGEKLFIGSSKIVSSCFLILFVWIYVSFSGRIASYVTEKCGKKASNKTKSNRNNKYDKVEENKNKIFRTYQ